MKPSPNIGRREFLLPKWNYWVRFWPFGVVLVITFGSGLAILGYHPAFAHPAVSLSPGTIKPTLDLQPGDYLKYASWIFIALSVTILTVTGVMAYFAVHHENRRTELFHRLEEAWKTKLENDVPNQIAALFSEESKKLGELVSQMTKYQFSKPLEERYLLMDFARKALWTNISVELMAAQKSSDGDRSIELWDLFFRGQTALRMLLSDDEKQVYGGLGYFYALADDERGFVPVHELWELLCLLNGQARFTPFNLRATVKLGSKIGRSFKDCA